MPASVPKKGVYGRYWVQTDRAILKSLNDGYKKGVFGRYQVQTDRQTDKQTERETETEICLSV